MCIDDKSVWQQNCPKEHALIYREASIATSVRKFMNTIIVNYKFVLYAKTQVIFKRNGIRFHKQHSSISLILTAKRKR